MNAWSIIDSCTIQKGWGVYDFETLLQQLIEQMGPDGLENMPMPLEDISGDHLTGVEADAIYEAIYEGKIGLDTAAVIMAGPQPGQEDAYMQAIKEGINEGAPIINQAIDIQNKIWDQKRNEELLRGKPGDKIPLPLPPAFDEDMGRMIQSPQWRDGVWGPEQDKMPWQYDQHGVPKIRIGNRDQENFKAESWARPYHEGLKALRPDDVKETSQTIEANKVRPGSVYLGHEAQAHIGSMMRELSALGFHQGNLTPDIIRDRWMNSEVLRNYTPEHMKSLQYVHNIRNREPSVAEAPPDMAQQAVEQQQAPPLPAPSGESQFGNYFPEGALQTGKGKSLAQLARQNYGYYGPKLFEAMKDQLGLEDLDMDQIIAMGGTGHRVDRMFAGMAAHINQEHPGFVPPHAQDPAPVPQPQAPPPVQEAPPIPQEAVPAPPPAPPAPPVPRSQPAPPVPHNQPAPPIPVGDVPPNNPPQEPASRLNTNEVRPSPVQRLDGPPQIREGWRGMLDRLAGAAGTGVGTVERWIGKEDVERALESIQCELALQDENIVKSLPHVTMSKSSASDISLIAGKIQRPASDVVAILNSRGDWREIAKSMDIPLECVQLVKVIFNE